MKRLWLGLLVAALVPLLIRATGLSYRHVMVVVLENAEYDDAIQQPFLSSLAHQGATLLDYHAVSHPSEPNYVALVGGSTFGIVDDGQYDLNGPHVGDLFSARGLSWKVYAEDWPGDTFTGASSGLYSRKHEPFISFKSVQNPAVSRAHVVNADQLKTDIDKGQLPTYSMYVPNANNDGHDTTIAYADEWLRRAFGPRLRDHRFTDGMLFVVTFDESNHYTGTNHILTVLVGDAVRHGSSSSVHYDHYSLLRTIEDHFHVGTLGREDATASPITGVWR